MIRIDLARLRARFVPLVCVLVGVAVVAPVADAAVRKAVIRDQVTVRNFPDEYVLGNAFRDWTMDVQGNDVLGYRWGFVYGNFQGCGYVDSPALADKAGTPNTYCAHNGYPGSYAPRVDGFTNGEVHCMRLSDGKCDGVVRHITCGSIDGWFNVRPWTSPGASSRWDHARTLSHGNEFRLRYTAAGGYWALGRDPYLSSTRGAGKGWIFVPRSCVS